MNTVETMFSEALACLNNGEDSRAHALCVQILSIDPQHFGACYMEACEAAHSGDVPAARHLFARALDAEPDNVLCRFQAGLLEFAVADYAAAAQVWAGLERSVPDGHFARLFASGCLALATGDVVRAEDLLRRGIASNHENPALNADMIRMLERIYDALRQAAGSTEPAVDTPAPADDSARSTLDMLHLYQANRTRH